MDLLDSVFRYATFFGCAQGGFKGHVVHARQISMKPLLPGYMLEVPHPVSGLQISARVNVALSTVHHPADGDSTVLCNAEYNS
jgi:hypothetical protein